jgi:hypothetical protein
MRVTYWIVFGAIYLGLGFLVSPGDDEPFGDFLRWLFLAGFVVLTWRCFRGAHETDEPRPAWRLTATSKYSFGLAFALSLLSLLPVIVLVGGAINSMTSTDFRWNVESPYLAIETLAQLIAAAFLYRSSARIRSEGLDPVDDAPTGTVLRSQA